MKKLLLFLFFLVSLCFTTKTFSQNLVSANTGDGLTAYETFAAAGIGVEGPDDSSPSCAAGDASDSGNHKDFGDHITEVNDGALGDVFAFVSHVDEDSDRCINYDRVRIEIKGDPGSSSNANFKHEYGDESFYSWQFRLAPDFVGTPSFTHLFQSKAQGGSNTDFPILTLTARTSIVEFIHGSLDDSNSAQSLVQAPLSSFTGQWVEVLLHQIHTDNGTLDLLIRDVATGATIMSYSTSDIDLWRETPTSGTINRPKWGIYRSLRLSGGVPDPSLRDETILFANFCSAENDAAVCGSLISNVTAPAAVTGLMPANGTADVTTNTPISWTASAGATLYTVYLEDGNGNLIRQGETTGTSLSIDLASNTTYTYRVGAQNVGGETLSAAATFTTSATVVPPVAVTNALPLDGSENVPLSMPLLWDASGNATSYNVYFGTSATPPLVTNTTATTYAPALAAGTTYYLQIGAANADGETLNAVQSFTTLANPDDGNWDVFRGHARPEEEVAALFALNSASAMLVNDEVRPVSAEAGNNAYCFQTSGSGNFRWRYDEYDGTQAITVVARLALNSANGISHFDFRGLGWRQKVRIDAGDIRFEDDGNREINFDPGYWDNGAFHIIRLTFQPEAGNMRTTVYLDESEVPFGSALSGESNGSSYLEFGHSGGSDYGACYDYFAADVTGAYAPGEGTALPSDLVGGAEVGDPPAGVAYSLPLDGSANVPATMPLVWGSVEGATAYDVYLGAGTPMLVAESVTDTFYYPTLTEETDYSYRIIAKNDFGSSLGDTKSFSTLASFDDGSWDVVRGHARPNVESNSDQGGFFEDQSNVGASVSESISIDGDGNNAYRYFSDEGTTGNYRWRYRPGAANEVTVVMRIANPDDNSDLTYVDYAGQGFRQKISIKRDRIQFQRPTTVNVDLPSGFFDNGEYKVIRITFSLADNGAPSLVPALLTNVYLEEEANSPMASQFSTTTDGSNYLDFGRAGGDNYGAAFDFIAIDNSGAFAPNEGAELPEDLGITALPLAWTEPLTVRSAGKVQVLQWRVGNQVDSDYFTVERSEDGISFTAIATLAANGNLVEERKFTYTDIRTLTRTTYYRIRQTDYDGAYSFSNTVAVQPAASKSLPTLFPNPTAGDARLNNLDPDAEVEYHIYDLTGRMVGEGRLAAGNRSLDVRALSPGTYLLRTVVDGTVQTNRFVRQ